MVQAELGEHQTWNWISDTDIHSVCISDVKGGGHAEIITAGESDGTKILHSFVFEMENSCHRK